MQSLGIRSGDRVGILMGNDEHWLSLFYGAALIGAVTVPVNTRFKTAEIDFCLKQADCKLLFYVERFLNIDFGSMVRETGFANAIDIDRDAIAHYHAVLASLRRHGLTPIVTALKKARSSIDTTIFRFDRPEIEKALEAAVGRGVNVRAAENRKSQTL